MIGRRRLFAPEVIQTSAMDCGPAALKCLLEGHGIPVSYGRLREACQTGVDGTSIDDLEALAVSLGLAAEQIMLPRDHLLHPAAGALPAIVVVRLPNGYTHFVVVWRRLGPLLEIMDPGTGRHLVNARRFLETTFVHTLPVPAAAWREWAVDKGQVVLRAQLGTLVGGALADDELALALADPSWRGLARLDAATRFVSTLERTGGISGTASAAALLRQLLADARQESELFAAIPESFWAVRPVPAPPSRPGSEATATAAPEAGSDAQPEEQPEEPPEEPPEEQVLLSGVVLLGARGKREEAAVGLDRLSPEMQAALREPTPRALPQVLGLLRKDGLLRPSLIAVGLVAASLFGIAEAVLMRSLFDIGRDLGVMEQRLGAVALLAAFLLGTLALEVPLASALRAMGRLLETRFRLAFMQKLPRLVDRYFQSRPVSDMAERSHAIQAVRQLPALGGQLARTGLELCATALAIATIDPQSGLRAIGVALAALFIPLLLQPILTERDLRWRSHGGALARFTLDTLLGLQPVRAHTAEGAIEREHEGLLVEWARAGRALSRALVSVDALTSLVSLGLVAWLLMGRFAQGGELGLGLLLLYWTLNLPILAQDLALQLRRYPAHRSRVLRLIEPLGAPEDAAPVAPPEATIGVASDAPEEAGRGVGLSFSEVDLVIAGHPVLSGLNLAITPGEQVAVVGPSGAGKSSLVGLLLGWHTPAAGELRVEGQPLDATRLATLRAQTAWVDPSVQLWNRSLLANLRYGSDEASDSPAPIIEAAELRRVIEMLPEGLSTPLGEGGGLVSGGEGQRVRFGRALSRDARLVILDEPFRGLDRSRRRALLERARRHFGGATLLCVTHDVGDTLGFDRVLVIEGGRLVEDGRPAELREREGSRFAHMLQVETEVLSRRWGGGPWRRLRLQEGRLVTSDEGKEGA